jgi:hypothetical protein
MGEGRRRGEGEKAARFILKKITCTEERARIFFTMRTSSLERSALHLRKPVLTHLTGDFWMNKAGGGGEEQKEKKWYIYGPPPVKGLLKKFGGLLWNFLVRA